MPEGKVEIQQYQFRGRDFFAPADSAVVSTSTLYIVQCVGGILVRLMLLVWGGGELMQKSNI